ncbi:MAG: nickel pincer cofactor biosynthesis protein LarB [Syntrophobacterales bacterium]|nr:nickel pincer cofactor biosynthesis protein LarB [Syntrophobacterales bacterium]
MWNIRKLLEDLRNGAIDIEDALEYIKKFPYEVLLEKDSSNTIAFARIDHHRVLRRGAPEVIYGEGKSLEHLIVLVEAMKRAETNVLITRLEPEKANKLSIHFPEGKYFEICRSWVLRHKEVLSLKEGYVAVLTGGTLDIPVAEEAAITAEFLGSSVKRFYDVGVAGIHRLFDNLDEIMKATVWVVVAGMEGALPSIVAGLVEGPVIAVPTSIGYGAHFGGLAPLLGALNSCSPGVVVVNIDNGFGGGYVASLIHRRIVTKRTGG